MMRGPCDPASLRLEVLEASKDNSQRAQLLATKVKSTRSEVVETVNVILEGIWSQNTLKKHTIIHLLNAKFDKTTNTYTVDNNEGLLVIDPDSLVTCTTVASSLFCERKTWLNHVFSGQAGTNKAMLIGTLVHEVFQYGVKHKLTDLSRLNKYLEELLDDATVMLETYSVEMHIADVRKEAQEYIKSVKEWIEVYMFSNNGGPLTNDTQIYAKVDQIQDIEENVWSTKYGLKGKIDVTGRVRIHDTRISRKSQERILPLELKTGNPNLSSSHAAQVSLYSMMIEDRYKETNQGLVIYLKDKAAMHNINLTYRTKRDLIQRRNKINYDMKNYFVGPDMLGNKRMCQNCERLTECILSSNLYDPEQLIEFPSMKELSNDAIGHLDDKFKQFFHKYHVKLVVAITGDVSAAKSCGDRAKPGSFWTYSSEEAEMAGTGVAKLQATSSKDNIIEFKRHPKHVRTFAHSISTDDETICKTPKMKKRRIEDYFKPQKKETKEMKSQPFDFQNFNYQRCRFAVSLDEDKQNMDEQNSSTAIAIGFINEITAHTITMKILEGSLDSKRPDAMYRVDKLVKKSSNLDIERAVFARLLTREDWRCERVKQLVLDESYMPTNDSKIKLFMLTEGFEKISELDDKQQSAVVDSLSTDTYFVIDEKSVPNKAQVHDVITVIACTAVDLNRSLLIVAQNIDQLVDLMAKLEQRKCKFIMIDDSRSKVARHKFASHLVKVAQVDGLDLDTKFNVYIRQHEEVPIVITSYAMSIGGLQFTRRIFEYCVAYDCDETELLLSLAPMFISNRHIIVDILEASSKPKETTQGDDVTLGSHMRSMKRKA